MCLVVIVSTIHMALLWTLNGISAFQVINITPSVSSHPRGPVYGSDVKNSIGGDVMGYSTTNVKNYGSLIVVDEEGYSTVDGCTYDVHMIVIFFSSLILEDSWSTKLVKSIVLNA